LRRSYQRNESQQEGNEVPDALEAYVREGARQMLAAVLEEEVNAFLGRHRYGRGQQFRGYRNGYHRAREVTVGLGPVEVRVPRVAQVPQEVAPQGFHSQVVQPRLVGGPPRLPSGCLPVYIWKAWLPETLNRCSERW
jgi:hypothetical protein